MKESSHNIDCLFCKIVTGTIPSKAYQDNDFCRVIADVNPQAPFHALVIPKVHMNDITECYDPHLLGRLFAQASLLAKEQGLSKGFRMVVNTGLDGGQTVDHLHIHVIGGRAMRWPPG
jgi:histidine triad (HIT) family protein